MDAFRPKKVRSQFMDQGSNTVNDMVLVQPKDVVLEGSTDPTTVIEIRKVNAHDYAKSINLPKDEDYQLRDMLKAGQLPEEVPVSGMLDSQDPTDLSNQGVGDVIFDRLASQVKSNEPAPAPEPAPVVEPSKSE